VRIVGGRHRGQPLRRPLDGIRPTADRAREAVFNILEHGIDWDGIAGISVVDLFAGTGALGLEALSRGAARATFIDTDGRALQEIRRNAAALGEASVVVLLKLDATRLAPPPRTAETPAALAFLDPPYESGLALPALAGLAAKGWIDAGAVCVVEVGAKEPLVPPPRYTTVNERVYGAARVVFLRFRE